MARDGKCSDIAISQLHTVFGVIHLRWRMIGVQKPAGSHSAETYPEIFVDVVEISVTVIALIGERGSG